MMHDVHKALYAFWSRFDVPAYVDGLVPPKMDAAGNPMTNKDGDMIPVDPPYITFEVANGEMMTTAQLAAMCWHMARNTDGENVQLERALLLDKIAEAIPEAGLQIGLDGGGYIVLRRNGGSWQSYYNPVDEPSVIAGRISYAVTYYAM